MKPRGTDSATKSRGKIYNIELDRDDEWHTKIILQIKYIVPSIATRLLGQFLFSLVKISFIRTHMTYSSKANSSV